MSFTDRHFLWFFLLTFAAWWLARGRYRWQLGVMIAASLIFYGHDHRWMVAVIAAYAAVDWATGLLLERSTRRRAILAAGVGFNLALLCFWKYTPLALRTAGWSGAAALGERWIVPMGISFYAFSGIAYMVDVYRGNARAERSFWRYLLFTSFFPHLVAGPILRARELLTELSPGRLPARPLAPLEGALLIARGYFKKLLLADGIGAAVDPFFANITQPSTAGVWSAPYVYLYALQIYFDFSGYTDIARGLGLWFGFRWPENFNLPYAATSVRDFWHRWHMTLSRFLRDYLYFPLGGSRHGEARTALNLLITMMLGGLWHGASWSFLVWGLLHGIYLVINRWWARTVTARWLAARRGLAGAAWRLASVALTFHAVCFAWCFFRLTAFGDSLACVRKAFLFERGKLAAGGAADASLWVLLALYAAVTWTGRAWAGEGGIEAAVRRLDDRAFWRGALWGAAAALLALAVALARPGERAPFIYFQF